MTAPGGFVIYAKNGQSAEQQSADRYECHTWAASQTGYDPTSASAGTPEQRVKLGPYRRAMSACLDAKGYSVTVGAPAAPATPVAPPPPVPITPAPTYQTPAHPAPVLVAQPSVPELKYYPFRMQVAGGYTATTQATREDLDSGGAAGLGLAWFPTPALPIGVRVDGSYDWLRPTTSLLGESGANYGHAHLYGGDADLQLDLAHRSQRSKLYLLGGIGWYKEDLNLRAVSLVDGNFCGWFGCGPGRFPVSNSVLNTTSPWEKSWNAGLGWEAAIADHTSFFIEARYERLRPYDSHMSFVPVTLGFRF